MGMFFGKHRASLIAAMLTILYMAMSSGHHSPENNLVALLILSMAGILLPLNMMIIAKLQDQQILSTQAVTTTAIISLQVIVGYWLAKNYTASLSEWLLYKPTMLNDFAFNNLPILVIASYLISILLIIWLIIKRGSVFEVAFLGALVGSFLSLIVEQSGAQQASSIYMSVAGLVLIWGIIHNSYLIAYIDELTDLPGRRAMNEAMARLKGNYTISMLDIDHFKKFNDSYGHDVGDQVLRMVATKIAAVHGGGMPYRYGGEEFAVIFPGKDSKAAFPHLSNLRETIDSTKMVLRNHNRPTSKPENTPSRKIPWQEVHVTISIGVANNDSSLTSATEVLKAADEALYRSKEKGRNRISQYQNL